MDLNILNSVELRALRVSIDDELKVREKNDLIKARLDIAEIARNIGMSLHELMSGTSSSAKGKKNGPVEAKYRNPDDAKQEWTGRGRKPNWVNDHIASGKTLSDLEIKP